MSDDSTDLILESAVSSFRERDSGGRILPSPTWWDLSPEDRDALFRSQFESRILERALDPAGISSTARAVLSRLG